MANTVEITCAAEPEALGIFRTFIEDECSRFGIPEEVVFDLKLAVDEVCSNVVMHGYKGMPPGSIILALQFWPDRVTVQITDFGQVFSPDQTPAPDLDGPLEDRRAGGLGWHLIFQTMDSVAYEHSGAGNVLTLQKKLD
jgi:serine/threonine-protein kinase RsbW